MRFAHEDRLQGNAVFINEVIDAAWPHWHEHLEMVFVQEGQLDFHISSVPIHLEKGDLLYIPADRIHSTVPFQGKPYPLLSVIKFNKDWLFSNADGYSEKILILKNGTSPYAGLGNLLSDYLCSHRGTEEGDEMKGISLLFWGILNEYGSEVMIPADKGNYHKPGVTDVLGICAYIENHLLEDISPAALAQIAGYSIPHFYRLFREATGYTVKSYTDAVRIHAAQRLLRSGEGNVTGVAYQLGFSNPNNFSRTYKRVTGHSPYIDIP